MFRFVSIRLRPQQALQHHRLFVSLENDSRLYIANRHHYAGWLVIAELFENIREVSIRINKFYSLDGDLEKENAGKELNTIIEYWLTKKAVKKNLIRMK